MKITVWSLTVDTKHGVSTAVHATEDAAWAELRSMFIGDRLWNGQSWDDKANHLTVADDTPNDVLSEWLTNGYNDVSFYGPDPITVDVPTPKVEIIHQVHPDAGCEFSYYLDGERVKESDIVMLHTLDAGRGYEFADWAEQAANTKFHASEAAWTHELDSYYGDPAGDQYIDGLPDDTEWLDHLEDEPENRVWWRTNYPDVPLSNLFEMWTQINDHDGDQRYDIDHVNDPNVSYWAEIGPEGDGTWSWSIMGTTDDGQIDVDAGTARNKPAAKWAVETWKPKNTD